MTWPALGTLLADESVAIAPETSGRVAKILFADGAPVEKGTPLFQFDTDLAQSDLAEAKARLQLAEASFARNQKLRQSGNVAQSAYDEALSARDVARAAVDAAAGAARQAHHRRALLRHARLPHGVRRRLCDGGHARSCSSTRSTGCR